MQHNHDYSYQNIYLRPLCVADLEYLRIWRNNPENTHYLRAIPYITPQMQKSWYDGYLRNEDEMTFGIVETETLQRLIGSLSLYHFQGNQAEFGKILIGDSEAHGKNAGLHATIAALKIGFEVLGLKRIVLDVYEENGAAVHIYKKAGFRTVDSRWTEDGRQELVMEVTRELLNV